MFEQVSSKFADVHIFLNWRHRTVKYHVPLIFFHVRCNQKMPLILKLPKITLVHDKKAKFYLFWKRRDHSNS